MHFLSLEVSYRLCEFFFGKCGRRATVLATFLVAVESLLSGRSPGIAFGCTRGASGKGSPPTRRGTPKKEKKKRVHFEKKKSTRFISVLLNQERGGLKKSEKESRKREENGSTANKCME